MFLTVKTWKHPRGQPRIKKLIQLYNGILFIIKRNDLSSHEKTEDTQYILQSQTNLKKNDTL